MEEKNKRIKIVVAVIVVIAIIVIIGLVFFGNAKEKDEKNNLGSNQVSTENQANNILEPEEQPIDKPGTTIQTPTGQNQNKVSTSTPTE